MRRSGVQAPMANRTQVPEGWRVVQLREAERRRDEAVAQIDKLLAELGYER